MIKKLKSVEDIIKYATKIDDNGCWIWLRSVNQVSGYPQINRKHRVWKVHRFLYWRVKGILPEELHHNCPNKPNILCVNPDHMLPVERQKNPDSPSFINSQKTYCINGHEFDKRNTYHIPSGGRACKTCRRENVYKNRGYPKGKFKRHFWIPGRSKNETEAKGE